MATVTVGVCEPCCGDDLEGCQACINTLFRTNATVTISGFVNGTTTTKCTDYHSCGDINGTYAFVGPVRDGDRQSCTWSLVAINSLYDPDISWSCANQPVCCNPVLPPFLEECHTYNAFIDINVTKGGSGPDISYTISSRITLGNCSEVGTGNCTWLYQGPSFQLPSDPPYNCVSGTYILDWYFTGDQLGDCDICDGDNSTMTITFG